MRSPAWPTARNASGDAGVSKAEGFEASVHKIKEQVLPRLLERVDPEAAATLDKNELAEEFRPIIGEVLAELKLTLNRREQFALEKVLVDELLGLGPLEELLSDPTITDIMVNGPDQTYIEQKGKLVIAPIQFRDEEHLFQIAQRICNSVGRRVDQTSPASRRPPEGRQPRQRDRPAAVVARHRDLDPQILRQADHARHDGRVRQHERQDGDRAEDRRRLPLQCRHPPAVPDRARRRCSTPCRR